MLSNRLNHKELMNFVCSKIKKFVNPKMSSQTLKVQKNLAGLVFLR